MEPGRTRAAGKLKIGGNWKPNTESLHIRFDSLEQLLVSEEAAQDIEAELPRPTDHDYTRKNPTTACEPRRPQRFALYSSSSGSILEGTSFIELGLAGQDLRHFFSQGRKNAWWLDVQNPSEKTVRQLGSAFGIHHLTVEDIVTGECGEKIEGFPFYYFTCVRSFHVVQTGSHFEYEPYNIYVVVFDEGALSFTFTQSEHSTHVRDRIELLKDYLSISSDWIFYALLDDIIDSFAPSITLIERQVNEIDDQVYTTRADDMQAFLRTIEDARRRVLSLIRLLSGKTNILRTFGNHHSEESEASEDAEEVPTETDLQRYKSPGEDIRLYIDDVQDHVTTMMSSLSQFEGLLSRSQNNYLAQLSIDNLAGVYRLNDFLGKMAVLTSVLSLLNFICNLFGQNVNGSVSFYTNNTYLPFALIVSGEAVLAAVLFYLVRRSRWFSTAPLVH